MNSEWRLSMRPSRLRSVARRSLVAVVTVVQAALVAVAAPPAHAAGKPDETFTLQLTGAGGADLGSPASRLGTIVDATATPKLRVADTTVAENDPAGHARFLVTLSAPSAGTVTVKASTAAGTAT